MSPVIATAVAGCGGSPPEYQSITPGATPEDTTGPPECWGAYRDRACETMARARELQATINAKTDVTIQRAGPRSGIERYPEPHAPALSMVSESTTVGGLAYEAVTVMDRFADAIAQGWDVDRLSVEAVAERGETHARYRFYAKTTWAEAVTQGRISHDECHRRVVETLGTVA